MIAPLPGSVGTSPPTGGWTAAGGYVSAANWPPRILPNP